MAPKNLKTTQVVMFPENWSLERIENYVRDNYQRSRYAIYTITDTDIRNYDQTWERIEREVQKERYIILKGSFKSRTFLTHQKLQKIAKVTMVGV